MTIDRSGKYWTGADTNDIHEYLSIFMVEDGQPLDEYRAVVCSCGTDTFFLEADRDEGTARRKCTNCKKVHFVCDSEEFWEESTPEKWKCMCKSIETNLGVGFSFYEKTDSQDAEPDIRWLYIGCRCVKCGVLGCFADWKVGYGPSFHLLNEV